MKIKNLLFLLILLVLSGCISSDDTIENESNKKSINQVNFELNSSEIITHELNSNTLISNKYSENISLVSITPPIYDNISYFKNGIAYYQLNNKFGLIDKDGIIITPAKYDKIYDIKNKFVKVLENDKIKYIDFNGNLITNNEYQNFESTINKNFKILGLDEYIYGEIFTEDIVHTEIKENPNYDVIMKNNKFGFIDNVGNEIISPKYEYASDFINDMAIVVLNNKFGAVNIEGKEIIEPKYDEISYFTKDKGIAIVKYKNKYGLIDKNGNEITKVIYDKLSYSNVLESDKSFFYSEKLIFTQNRKMGLLDSSGNSTILGNYDEISFLSDNLYTAYKNDKSCIINSEGKQLTKLEYTYIEAFQNFIIVGKNNKKGVLNYLGEEIIPIKYDYLKGCNQEGTNINNKVFFTFSENNKFGIIDSNNKVVIEPIYYKPIINSIQNLFVITENGKKGVINDENIIILEIKYDNILFSYLSENIIINATLGNLAFLYNEAGNEIISKNKISICYLNGNPINYFKVCHDNMYGIIDIDGNIIIPIHYKLIDYILDDNNNMFFIVCDENNHYNLYTEYNYNTISSEPYYSFKYLNENIFSYKNKQGKYGISVLNY